eukprot:GHVU01014861.1.p2 GENE.GHVU01014861.1~~GHVU01014861.1.p2  ORF type:complete len:120 (+),score=9.97 GHVU01014861.1:385-744(+)
MMYSLPSTHRLYHHVLPPQPTTRLRICIWKDANVNLLHVRGSVLAHPPALVEGLQATHTAYTTMTNARECVNGPSPSLPPSPRTVIKTNPQRCDAAAFVDLSRTTERNTQTHECLKFVC